MIKCEASILSLFRNELNKLNNTVAHMHDSTYHMTLKLFCNVKIKNLSYIIDVVIGLISLR